MTDVASTAPKKRAVDWERVEDDYRAGVLSTREMGTIHGVSHVAIVKRAKRLGWDRDLSARIQAKADALVAKQAISEEQKERDAANEKAVIDANASRIAEVRGEHRVDISRARRLTMTLLDELEQPPQRGTKTVGLYTRAGTLRHLTESLRTVVTLERQAYGIDKAIEGDGDSMFGAITRRIVDPAQQEAQT